MLTNYQSSINSLVNDTVPVRRGKNNLLNGLSLELIAFLSELDQ